MYQHYVTETRVAQYQQQLMGEATIARQVRASRQATAQPGAVGTGSFLATWLRTLRNQVLTGWARTRVAHPR
jgi:hypothetical protein